MVVELDALDRRIVGALQVSPRAPWRQIAAVLGEPERTIARRGSELIHDGTVKVIAVAPMGESAVVRVRCHPGMSRMAAAALARRPDTTACYLLTGRTDVFAEVFHPRDRLAPLVLDELGGTLGAVEVQTSPVTRYFRGAHDWRPGLLTDAEVAALTHSPTTPLLTGIAHLRPLTPDERVILSALATDGRLSNGALGRQAGLSEQTVGRRLEALRREGRMLLRAVIDPRLLGLPVEAMLWITAAPRQIDPVGEALAEMSQVRYAASTMGAFQLVAHLVVRSIGELHEIVTGSTWSGDVTSVETSLIIGAPKRSGVIEGILD